MVYKYSSVICAGTFEHVHEGHRKFLRFAFSLGEHVYVTITSDLYTTVHKPHAAPFVDRVTLLKDFLEKEGFLQRAEVVPIDDIYGIALDKNINAQALVVTEETITGAQKVNEKRIACGLPRLIIEVCPMTIGPTGLAISSTHIRTGMFATNGDLLVRNEFMHADLLLPHTLRSELQKPFGKIATSDTYSLLDPKQTIAVGDVTTRVLHEKGIQQALSLVDFVVQREKQDTSLVAIGFDGNEVVFHATNPPGMITPELWHNLEAALEVSEHGQVAVVVVDGEEDLAVLPLLLVLPFGYTICYGQPHVGMVMLPVTQETKQLAIATLSRFSRRTTRGY